MILTIDVVLAHTAHKRKKMYIRKFSITITSNLLLITSNTSRVLLNVRYVLVVMDDRTSVKGPEW